MKILCKEREGWNWTK